MTKQELVISTSRDILAKAIEAKVFSVISSREGAAELGEIYKIITVHVEEALSKIK